MKKVYSLIDKTFISNMGSEDTLRKNILKPLSIKLTIKSSNYKCNKYNTFYQSKLFNTTF